MFFISQKEDPFRHVCIQDATREVIQSFGCEKEDGLLPEPLLFMQEDLRAQILSLSRIAHKFIETKNGQTRRIYRCALKTLLILGSILVGFIYIKVSFFFQALLFAGILAALVADQNDYHRRNPNGEYPPSCFISILRGPFIDLYRSWHILKDITDELESQENTVRCVATYYYMFNTNRKK